MQKTDINIGTEFLEQLKAPGGLALAFSGLALSLVSIYVLPDWKISVQSLITTSILFFAALWIFRSICKSLIHRLLLAEENIASSLNNSRSSPKVVQAMSHPNNELGLILLLESNRLFGQSMLVSIYFEDSRGFELLVGSGTVANVQTNGLIQISVTGWEEGHIDIKREIVAQNAEKVERLLVRPAPTTQQSQDLTTSQLTLWASLEARLEKWENEQRDR